VTFTYNLASADPLIVEISQARFELGDVVASRGPRANGTNFSDEELTMVLNRQGILGAASRPLQAVAALCDTLAREWSKVATTTVGPRSQQFGSVASEWGKRAVTLRQIYGGSSSLSFSIPLTRVDGYSDNAGGAGGAGFE
jgi:hypothetical protein